MPRFLLATDEEQATKEREQKQNEDHRERSLEDRASSKGHILKKNRDSHLLIPRKKTRLTLDDIINFLKNS